MSELSWREKMKQFDKNAEMIFDREEPIGTPTDMVLPDRRWFRRKLRERGAPVTPQPNK